MKSEDKAAIQRQPALAEQVAEFLTKKIINGEFTPGQTFPSENELCKRLNVSRSVIREALSRMKHDGLLESKMGGRTRVAQDPTGHAFRFDLKEESEDEFLKYLYEMRAIIEPEAAAIAALRSTKGMIKDVKAKFVRLKKALKEKRDATEESIEFHKSLIEASGNPHLAKFVSWVEKKVWSFTRSNNVEQNGQMILEVQQEHEAIINAIEKRDPKKARLISRQHVIGAARRHGIEIIMPEY